MDDVRPIVVDLFAGAGGLSLGFEQAGFDIVAAVEIDPVHACIHKFNFPNCVVIPGSVTDFSGAEIRQIAGLGAQRIDVVIGGAPCQGFSIIGRRVLDDPRNLLIREFIRLVSELQPSYFLFENVKGLAFEKHRHFLDEIIDELSNLGYALLPVEVLNAKNFGVPQSRERLFIIGTQANYAQPAYPAPSDGLVTCSEALGDLPDVESFEELLMDSKVRTKYLKNANGYSELMRCSTRGSWRYGYQRLWDPMMLTNSRRTEHSEVSRYRFSQTKPGTREPISRFFRLASDGVSTTLRAGTDSARGSFTSPRPIHYKYARCITVREMARLHGFPDWFQFHTTKWHGARQIGNSVPPPLAFSIASEIMNVLSVRPCKPTKPIPLGNESLLSMDVPSASKYWGIENPIEKRDRKRASGSKMNAKV
ncbi:MAG: DNA cytosine methyltransferase [Cyanobacteria bacterium J06634_5]